MPVTPDVPGAMLAAPVAGLPGCWVTGAGAIGWVCGTGTSAGFLVERPKASGGAVFFAGTGTAFSTVFGGVIVGGGGVGFAFEIIGATGAGAGAAGVRGAGATGANLMLSTFVISGGR